MGASNTKRGPPSGLNALMYGSFKVTGQDLFLEGVIVQENGTLPIGRSPDLVLKISSVQEGKFEIKPKYLGSALVGVEFSHEELISLLQDPEASTEYQDLRKRFNFSRQNNLLRVGGLSFDVTKLLPFLYECFAKQNLSDKGERLVQEKQLERLNSVSKKKKKPSKKQTEKTRLEPELIEDAAMVKHVKELEALERALASKLVK